MVVLGDAIDGYDFRDFISIPVYRRKIFGRRQQTRVQQLREGEAIREVEEWKSKQRMLATQKYNTKAKELCSVALNGEKGETRDIVAKIIGWGTGGKNSGKDYSLGRSALKEADRRNQIPCSE